MKRYLPVIYSAILILSINQYASAQKKTTKTTPPPDPKAYKLFFEKVYVHTDREYYASGDDLWFKAYLVNATSNHPTYTSNNLYIDLISPDSKVYAREILRLDSGVGVGDFKLTDSIPGGTYHLKAYTNWMRNFGDNFVFDKKIVINSVPGVKVATATATKGKPGKGKPALVTEVANAYHINFFPEGGSLVDGVQSIVGFKAEDLLGAGVRVQGNVVSSKGDTVGRFESTDSGMGLFAMLPVAGTKYSVVGKYKNGKAFVAELPVVLAEGYCLHTKNTDSASVQVIVSTNQATLDKHKGMALSIAAKHADHTYFSGSFNLTELQTAISIPKAQAPAGVNVIMLTDEMGRPNCERLVYVNPKDDIKLSVVPDKATYAPKEKSTITIKVTDSKNQPVKANLSMAAVDGSIVPADDVNITSYLMLQSEVKGKIDNAAQYFDPANANRFKQLDLLLMTQGWRDFVWKRLADSALKVSFLPESGFTVSGKLRSVLINKPIANGNITLFAPGAKGGKLFGTRTDANGRYYLDGIQLFGNQTLKLAATDDKGKKSGWIFLDTVGSNVMPVTQMPMVKEEASAQLTAFNTASSARMTEAKRHKIGDVIQLKEVNIREAPKTITLRDQVVQSFGYPEYDYDITAKDVYADLQDFLVHKVPGAQVNPDTTSGILFYWGGKKVFPRFVVDKQEDVFERIDYYNLSMSDINSVRVNHMVSMGGGDVMLIYLSLKPSAFEKKQFNLLNNDVTGYYSARTFYAPNYEYPSTKTDQRITLHWEPIVSTDANGEATINYYNADPKSKIRVVVQGLTDKGTPIATTAGYTVK
jgi:hypothetical protein